MSVCERTRGPKVGYWLVFVAVQGGSMPNTSSSVPFLLSSSMQSIRSRRPSTCSQGSGLLQQLGSGMVRLTSSHHAANGKPFSSSTVRKCPSLNITFNWNVRTYMELIFNNIHIPAYATHMSLLLSLIIRSFICGGCDCVSSLWSTCAVTTRPS